MNDERILTPAEEEQLRAEVRRELAQRQAQERQRSEERMQREQEKARAQEVERIRRDEEARLLSALQAPAIGVISGADPKTGSGSRMVRRRRHHNRFTLNTQLMKEMIFAAFFLTALAALYFYYKS
jgi:hypothetical protein